MIFNVEFAFQINETEDYQPGFFMFILICVYSEVTVFVVSLLVRSLLKKRLSV